MKSFLTLAVSWLRFRHFEGRKLFIYRLNLTQSDGEISQKLNYLEEIKNPDGFYVSFIAVFFIVFNYVYDVS